MKRRVGANALPIVVVALPLLAATLAGAGYEHSYRVWLVCLGLILLYALLELKRCRESGIATRLPLSLLTGFVIIGCLFSISSVTAVLQLGRTSWFSAYAFLLAQGFGTVVCVVASGARKPQTLVRLDRAIHIAGILVCLSVVIAHFGFAFGWRFGEVQQSWHGIRSFGPLGDGVAWLVALFLSRWGLRGEKGWCVFGGAALALTGSMGPPLTLGLGIITLAALDAGRRSGHDFRRIWKKRAVIASWIVLGMIVVSFPLPDFSSAGRAEQLDRLPRYSGFSILFARLLPAGPDKLEPNISRTGNERLGNMLISLDLVRRHWLIGAGYGATSWRYEEVPWRTYVSAESVPLYKQGTMRPYAVNVWLQLAVSGGLFALGAGLWIWIRLFVTMHRRMSFPAEPHHYAADWSFMWILLAGFMLTADWLLCFSPVFQLVCVAVGVSLLHIQHDNKELERKVLIGNLLAKPAFLRMISIRHKNGLP